MNHQQLKIFEDASNYTNKSVQCCKEMESFIRRRLAIEEDYAKALRKLCKNVSQRHLQEQAPSKDSSFSFLPKWMTMTKKERRRRKSCLNSPISTNNDASSIPNDPYSDSTLWKTFYELVDDTNQISKAHTAMAENLAMTSLNDLTQSIPRMEDKSKKIQEQRNEAESRILKAESMIKKQRKSLDSSQRTLLKQQESVDIAKDRYKEASLKQRSGQMAPEATDRLLTKLRNAMDQAQLHKEQAESSLMSGRMKMEGVQETLNALQEDHCRSILPNLVKMLEEEEDSRSLIAKGALEQVLQWDNRLAEMTLHFSKEMEEKFEQKISLTSDRSTFNRLFSAPIEETAGADALMEHMINYSIQQVVNSSSIHELSKSIGAISPPPSYNLSNSEMPNGIDRSRDHFAPSSYMVDVADEDFEEQRERLEDEEQREISKKASSTSLPLQRKEIRGAGKRRQRNRTMDNDLIAA